MKKRALILLASTLIGPLGVAQSTPIAIVNARIEIGNGQVIEKGTVVVRDGKIVSVGTSTAPEGAGVIDGSGETVYPGFIDGYTSRGVSIPTGGGNVGSAPETRTQAPPSMWEGNRKGIHASFNAAPDAWKVSDFTDYYKQGLLAGLVAPGSGIIRGTASVCEYRKAGRVLLANAGMELATRSAGGGQGGDSQSYPQTILGVIAFCRQFLYDAQHYGQMKNLGGAEKKDDNYEALQPMLAGQEPAIFEADSDREVFRSLNIAEEFNLKAVVKGGRESAASADHLKNVPVLLRIDYADEPSRTPDVKDPDATPKPVLDAHYKEWQDRLANPRKLAEAGVKFAFSSDGGLIDDYLANVRKVITFGGLSRGAALKAMTSDAAQILGVADKLGTVEVGKMANLVIMSGDFASKDTVVKIVIVGGERVDVKK